LSWRHSPRRKSTTSGRRFQRKCPRIQAIVGHRCLGNAGTARIAVQQSDPLLDTRFSQSSSTYVASRLATTPVFDVNDKPARAVFILFVDKPTGFVTTEHSETRELRVLVLKNCLGLSTPAERSVVRLTSNDALGHPLTIRAGTFRPPAGLPRWSHVWQPDRERRVIFGHRRPCAAGALFCKSLGQLKRRSGGMNPPGAKQRTRRGFWFRNSVPARQARR
jgi:hypothetical protein